MKKHLTTGAVVLTAAGLFAVGGVGSATAAKLITGDNIARNAITDRHLAADSVGGSELKPGIVSMLQQRATDGVDGKDGVNGSNGADGKDGKNGVSGIEYRTYDYIAGGARPGHDGAGEGYTGAGDGSIATVACSSPAKVAIAGGVQFSGLHGGDLVSDGQQSVNDNWTLVDSFPGRMDWDTNKPKADRHDGWIVRLNSTSGAPSTDVTVWTICVDAA